MDEAIRRRHERIEHIRLRCSQRRCVDCGNEKHWFSPFWCQCRACGSLVCRTCRERARNWPGDPVNKTWRCPGCGMGPDREGRWQHGIASDDITAAYGHDGPDAGMELESELQFAAALVGAAIGGIVATLVTGDALAVVVALIAGPCVYHLVGAMLGLDNPPLTAATYARVLVGVMAATGVALSYILVGAWAAVVVVVVWVAVIVVAILHFVFFGDMG
jgi:hypothetical protein